MNAAAAALAWSDWLTNAMIVLGIAAIVIVLFIFCWFAATGEEFIANEHDDEPEDWGSR